MILLYIDPGSGSMIIQALIAGAIAAPFLLRQQLRNAVDAVRRLVGRPASPAPRQPKE